MTVSEDVKLARDLIPNPSQARVFDRIDDPYPIDLLDPETMEPGSILKVVAFNLHQGRKLLQSLGALQNHPELKGSHVAALQEVDRFNDRTGGVDLSLLLSRETQMNGIYGVEFIELNRRRGSGGGDHGNQTLTRLPILASCIVPLSIAYDWSRSKTLPRLGRRMALITDLEVAGSRIRIINAHLEVQCFARQRLEQLETILEFEAGMSERCPAILLGDLNTFMFREPVRFRQLATRYDFVDALPRRPRGTWGQIFRLDWILVRSLEIVSSGITRDVRGSDHKPIWATLKVP